MTATLFDHLEARTAAAVARADEIGEIGEIEEMREFEALESRLSVRMRDAIARQRAAEVDILVTAAAWADAHVHEKRTGAVPGFDHAMVLAGAGAPAVSDYAVSELGGLMGVTFDTALALLGDAIELRHRLPQLWALTTSARTVSVALARQIADMTRDLSWDAAADADLRLCRSRRRIDRRRARIVVDEVRLWHDPDRAIDDEQRALGRRGVWLSPSPAQRSAEHTTGDTPATAEMFLILDTLEAQRFETAVSKVATRLGALGDTDSWDVRRAKAVGVLADPQTALDLLSGDGTNPPTSAPGGVSATLYLHLTDAALLEQGPITIERLGTASRNLITSWLSDSHVVVRPVLDLQRLDAVDRHDPPDWMREQVVLKDRHCIFPGCTRDARFCDLDHINPYVSPDQGGPPGQTHPHNLAPLCRRHHRAKTHGHFTYQRLPDGSYHWTLPAGHHLTITP